MNGIPLTQAEKDLIVKLRKDKLKHREIAEIVGRSATIVCSVLKKAGLRTRPAYRSLHGSYNKAKVPKGSKPNRVCLRCNKPFHSPDPIYFRLCSLCNYTIQKEGLAMVEESRIHL